MPRSSATPSTDPSTSKQRPSSGRQSSESHLSRLQDPVQVIPNRLVFACYPHEASTASSITVLPDPWSTTTSSMVHWIIDAELVYARFFADFGPLQLNQIVRFCRKLQQKLNTLALHHQLVVSCRDHPHARANAITLLVIFQVVQNGLTPHTAWKPFRDLHQPPFGFRDASMGICSFFISAVDCASAFQRAIQLDLWNYNEFSVENYEALDELANGDINWIIPNKILAFSGPLLHTIPLEQGKSTLAASDYAKLFKQLGVGCVVRLNESNYDKKPFLLAGIRHIDLEFPDGSAPNDDILFAFLRICQREKQAIAVHCKAGLGRTGTLIAAFLLQQYHFTAREAIAWCRICRPGSIVGIQQHFLLAKQHELWQKPPERHLTSGTTPAPATSELVLSRRRKTPHSLRSLRNVKAHQS